MCSQWIPHGGAFAPTDVPRRYGFSLRRIKGEVVGQVQREADLLIAACSFHSREHEAGGYDRRLDHSRHIGTWTLIRARSCQLHNIGEEQCQRLPEQSHARLTELPRRVRHVMSVRETSEFR